MSESYVIVECVNDGTALLRLFPLFSKTEEEVIWVGEIESAFVHSFCIAGNKKDEFWESSREVWEKNVH